MVEGKWPTHYVQIISLWFSDHDVSVKQFLGIIFALPKDFHYNPR